MALTRKMLKAMGIEEEKIDQIIEAHSETVQGLKDKLEEAEGKAKDYDTIKAENDKLKADGGYKEKYEKEHSDFEAFKKTVNDEKNKSAKEAAVKAFFESKNITGKNLDIAMRGSAAEISDVVLEDGKIKDSSKLEALVKDTFAGLVEKSSQNGAKTPTPPGGGGVKKYNSKDEIMAITDTNERIKAIANNHEMFGY